MDFDNFNLKDELMKALADLKYIQPTPIQENSITEIMNGKDLIGIAQTGTGKTAAFGLPILDSFLKNKKETRKQYPKALILAPTRELCAQIGKNIKEYSKYTDIKSLVAYGGVSSESQIEALKEKQDILIATPGRLVDLIKQKNVFLDDIEVFVLDEADKIIKMGLRVDLKRIIEDLPKIRQNLFFSATIDKDTKKVSKELLKDPVRIDIENETKNGNLKLIQQNILYVLKADKNKLLVDLLKRRDVKYAIIFVNSKLVADNIVRVLTENKIKSVALHSGKSNTHREKVIRQINTKATKFLIATDLASRGLDFSEMTHVINYEVPFDFESYTHRIGRIGRAGKKGIALSLCSLEDIKFFKKIEKTSKYPITVMMHEYHSKLVKNDGKKSKGPRFKPRKRISSSGYNNRGKQAH